MGLDWLFDQLDSNSEPQKTGSDFRELDLNKVMIFWIMLDSYVRFDPEAYLSLTDEDRLALHVAGGQKIADEITRLAECITNPKAIGSLREAVLGEENEAALEERLRAHHNAAH